jgi:hypothetical protein
MITPGHKKHKKLKLKKFNFNTFLTVLFRPFFEFLHVCHTSVDVRDKCSKTVNKLELLETKAELSSLFTKIIANSEPSQIFQTKNM